MRYSDDFGSDLEEEHKITFTPSLPTTSTALTLTNSSTPLLGSKRKYGFYDIEDEGARPKYKNELTTCHFCRKRDRKPKTRYFFHMNSRHFRKFPRKLSSRFKNRPTHKSTNFTTAPP